jgi:hypothetical protein
MGTGPLRATDLLPLAQKLSADERVRLAKILLRTPAGVSTDAAAYAAQPTRDDEFGSGEEALAWEAEGWEEFYEAG